MRILFINLYLGVETHRRTENASIERDVKLGKLIITVERHIPSTILSRADTFSIVPLSLSLTSVAR